MHASIPRRPICAVPITATLLTLSWGPLAGGQALPAPSGYAPKVHEDDGEAALALARIEVPEGFHVELFAAEPLCANLVALDVDPFGRCYVVETFRRDRQVLDMRDWPDWVEDDLACRTVADRVAMIHAHEGANASIFRREHERIRLLRDLDFDGRADVATVFADGFDDHADGIAAGVLARGGEVWLTSIPSVFKLRDLDGDGMADRREVVSTGYGVHFNYVGHDLHGLRVGPDGRMYFSIGDRGLDVTTREGRRLVLPDAGAVLRCELDGSGLELWHTGLRNPQELAFNDAGDLFTCDNNSDGGDRARLVHVVEGGETGWQVGFQWISTPQPRGPWNAERMWEPRHEGQPAFLLPCVANLVAGPSGLTHEPGTCFGERFRDRFFVCDFEGQWDNTRVVSFAVEPDGAGYRLVAEEPFVAKGIVATDCDFAADGCMYVSDWVGGWVQTGRGRVWRIFEGARRGGELVAQTRRLLQTGMERRGSAELLALLAHPDQRVRLEAQFELAHRGAVDELAAAARWFKPAPARAHGVWGLGQVARRFSGSQAAAVLRELLHDGDGEVRAQAAKALGEARLESDDEREAVVEGLVALLFDPQPRPRFFAAIALGRLRGQAATGALAEMLRENGDRDATLRHAGVMGLVGCASELDLEALANDPSSAVRMGVLLAMRRRGLAAVRERLADPDRALAVEAARAIHDVPIEAGFEALAASLEDGRAVEEPLLLRAVDAAFRLGGREQAGRLARFAAQRADVAEGPRADAIRALSEFDAPPARDRVLGVFRPCGGAREPAAVEALRPHLATILAAAPDAVREEAARFVGRHLVEGSDDALAALAAEEGRASGARVAAIDALAAVGSAGLRSAIETALRSGDEHVRSAARRALAGLDPTLALLILDQALVGGTMVERQSALATLGEMADARATEELVKQLDLLLQREVEAELVLDLLLAAEAKRSDAAVAERLARFESGRAADDPLAAWRECATGGDPARGRRLFFERNDLQCLKCHRVGAEGAGEAGPDLAAIGGKQPRGYLLESIALPNRTIAEGFRNTIFVLADGDLVDGRVIGESEAEWTLHTSDRGAFTLPKAGVASFRPGLSSMPADLVGKMSKRDLRDLVEFLASLR